MAEVTPEQRRKHGLSAPYSTDFTSEDTAVSPVTGPRPNEVLWWHRCSVEEGWIASAIPNHTITGSIASGDLTIRASLLCGEGCGKHGFITDLVWTDA
jgi:hypothetical protein